MQTIKTALQSLASWDLDDVLLCIVVVFITCAAVSGLVLFFALLFSGDVGQMFGAFGLAGLIAVVVGGIAAVRQSDRSRGY